jgi:transcriptional regulator with XRE-family HTH domain
VIERHFSDLEQVRKALKPTQAAAAKELGIPAGSLSGFLSGKQMLTDEDISSLSEFLKCPVKRLTELYNNRRRANAAEAVGMRNFYAHPGTRTDYEEVLRWLLQRFSDVDIRTMAARAVDEGRTDVARVFLDAFDERSASSAADASAKELLGAADGGTASPAPPGSAPRTGADAPSETTSSRPGAGEQGAKGQRGSPTPAPGGQKK